MQRTKRYLARLLALAAIAAVAVAVVVIVSGYKDDAGDAKGPAKKTHTKAHKPKPKTTAKTYTIQSGDTLTAIAHKTGVNVHELQVLNPEIDPQILIAGQTLKLR